MKITKKEDSFLIIKDNTLKLNLFLNIMVFDSI